MSNQDLRPAQNQGLEDQLVDFCATGNWRPALGWFYSKYKEYFDPNPNFDKWDGAYTGGDDLMDPSLTPQQVSEAVCASGTR